MSKEKELEYFKLLITINFRLFMKVLECFFYFGLIFDSKTKGQYKSY